VLCFCCNWWQILPPRSKLHWVWRQLNGAVARRGSRHFTKVNLTWSTLLYVMTPPLCNKRLNQGGLCEVQIWHLHVRVTSRILGYLFFVRPFTTRHCGKLRCNELYKVFLWSHICLKIVDIHRSHIKFSEISNVTTSFSFFLSSFLSFFFFLSFF